MKKALVVDEDYSVDGNEVKVVFAKSVGKDKLGKIVIKTADKEYTLDNSTIK